MQLSLPSKPPLFLRSLALLLAAMAMAIVVLAVPHPAYADVGPKPSMEFEFIQAAGAPVVIVEAVLLQCQDPDCLQSYPLEEIGPQRFLCNAGSCSSMAYGYAEYQRLQVKFSDGKTRQSNIFRKKYFEARYQVTVRPLDLLVEEQRGSLNPLGVVLVSAIVVGCLLGLIMIAMVAVIVFWAFKARQEEVTYSNSPRLHLAAWLVALPILTAGTFLSISLPVTLAVEAILALVYAGLKQRRWLTLLTVVFLANLVTQPCFALLLNLVDTSYILTLTLAGEILIWFVEAAILHLALRKTLSVREALLLSLLLNASSFAVGLLLPI